MKENYCPTSYKLPSCQNKYENLASPFCGINVRIHRKLKVEAVGRIYVRKLTIYCLCKQALLHVNYNLLILNISFIAIKTVKTQTC